MGREPRLLLFLHNPGLRERSREDPGSDRSYKVNVINVFAGFGDKEVFRVNEENECPSVEIECRG